MGVNVDVLAFLPKKAITQVTLPIWDYERCSHRRVNSSHVALQSVTSGICCFLMRNDMKLNHFVISEGQRGENRIHVFSIYSPGRRGVFVCPPQAFFVDN